MAKHYGTTPSRLLSSDLGDWSVDFECWQADMRDQQIERQKAERGRGPRSAAPPDWPG